MEVIIDYQRVARLRQVSQVASLGGFVLLVGALVLAFTLADNVDLFFYQFIALLVGWGMSQVGMYLFHRYGRKPRSDEVLDDALRKVAAGGRLYHYVLPAPHVLLTRSGPIILVAKYQTGNISVKGDKWRQSGVGLGKIFGQQGLGNPTKDTERQIGAMANFIRKHAPDIEEVSMGAIVVFTTKGLKTLDLDESRIPAMHYTKLRGYLKQEGLGESLPDEVYAALRTAFDAKAGDLVAEIV